MSLKTGRRLGGRPRAANELNGSLDGHNSGQMPDRTDMSDALILIESAPDDDSGAGASR